MSLTVPVHRTSASAFSPASLARYVYRAAPSSLYAPATTRLRPSPRTFTRTRHQSSAATSPNSKKAPYLVPTTSLPLSALEHRPHPLNGANYRYQVSLGDSTGLTKLGVHYCRLPAGATSTTLHWHSHEDEWFYVLQAGEDARLLVWEPNEVAGSGECGAIRAEEVVPREERVQAGDFVGFKAGVRRAHAFKAGGEEMVYLVGGSREPLDVSYYPAAGKRQVTDLTDLGTGSWTVEDKEVKPSGRKVQWPVVDLS